MASSSLALAALLVALPLVAAQPVPYPSACVDDNAGSQTVFGTDCATFGTITNGCSRDFFTGENGFGVYLQFIALCPATCDKCRQCEDNNYAVASIQMGSCEAASGSCGANNFIGTTLKYFCPETCEVGCPSAPAACVDGDAYLAELGDFPALCDGVEINGGCEDSDLASLCPRHCGTCLRNDDCSDWGSAFNFLYGQTCAVNPRVCNDVLGGAAERLYCADRCDCCDNNEIVEESFDLSCADAVEDPTYCTSEVFGVIFSAACRVSCGTCAGRECENSANFPECVSGNEYLCAAVPFLYEFYCPELCQVQQVCDPPSNPPTPSPAQTPAPTPDATPDATPAASPSPSTTMPTCYNDDEEIDRLASFVGYGNLVDSCADVRSFCNDRTYGTYARTYCPLTCGFCPGPNGCVRDDDAYVDRLAASVGFGYIDSCAEAVRYVSCNDAQYGSYLRSACPCTCAGA